MSKFDALELAVDKPSRMTIMRPGTREPLCNGTAEPAWIDLLSDDSQAAQAFDDRQNDRRIQQRQTSGNITVTSAEVRKQQVERLAVLTVGWRLVGLNGESLDVPFNQANAVELYGSNRMAWLVDQVVEHVNRRANFMPAKSSDSSSSPSTNSA